MFVPPSCPTCAALRGQKIALCPACEAALYPERERDQPPPERSARDRVISEVIGALACVVIAIAGLSAILLDARALAAIDAWTARMIATVIG